MKGKPMNLIDSLDRAVLKVAEREREEHGEKQRHSITSYGWYDQYGKYHGRCIRAQYFEWSGFQPTDREPKSQYRMNMGKRIEQMVGELLVEDGWAGETQVEVLTNHIELKNPIKGLADFLVTRDGQKVLLEVKSVNSRAFRYELPKEDHISQICWYAKFIRANEHILMYVSRDDFYRQQYKLYDDFDPVPIDDMRAWVELEAALREGKPPPCSYDKKSWRCKYCDYASLCRWVISPLIGNGI